MDISRRKEKKHLADETRLGHQTPPNATSYQERGPGTETDQYPQCRNS